MKLSQIQTAVFKTIVTIKKKHKRQVGAENSQMLTFIMKLGDRNRSREFKVF